jgi:thiol-disulfide isomerase/thioredoxin
LKSINTRVLLGAIAAIGRLVLFYSLDEGGIFHRRPPAEAVSAADNANLRDSQSVFTVFESPQPMPGLKFMNRRNLEISLQAFRGSFVLLNVWATWCAPCREEMPALDRLQRKLGGPDFHVLALSIDEAHPSVIRKFYERLEIETLFVYHDPTASAFSTLKLPGIPTTYLIDRDGMGIGYVVGPVEWDNPEIVDEINRYLSAARESD